MEVIFIKTDLGSPFQKVVFLKRVKYPAQNEYQSLRTGSYTTSIFWDANTFKDVGRYY